MTSIDTSTRTSTRAVRALTLATLVWPVAPALAQDAAIDLEALQQRHQAQVTPPAPATPAPEVAAPPPRGAEAAPADAAARARGFAEAYPFPEDLDGLLAILDAEIAARPPAPDILASSCEVVADMGGSGPLWQEHCEARDATSGEAVQ